MPCEALATCCASRAVFHSIRARLTVWLVLLVMLCLVAFAVYLYAAIGHILTTNLDETLRVQAQQIAANYDFDVLKPEHDKEKDQRYVDTIVGGQSAASRIWAEVLDTQGHILTRSSNLGPRHLPLPAPASTLVRAAPHLATLPAPAARPVDAAPHLSTQAVPGGVLRVYSLPARHKGHIVGVVVVAALRNKAATTPAAVGRILTADLDQALRVQAHQIAAVYDFDVLQAESAQEQKENQQSVDTSVGGQSAASRIWAEVFDTRGHILTRSSNLGLQQLTLPAPALALLHAAPRLATQAGPGGALHVYTWPAIDNDGEDAGQT